MCLGVRLVLILTALAAATFAAQQGASSPHDLSSLPDVPKSHRPTSPLNVDQAVVYTVDELIQTPYAMELARKVSSEVLIRAWFKWRRAPDWSKYRQFADEAHGLGMLFGGGVTCSAVYDDENGLTRDQVLDMSTRDAEGKLFTAWKTAGAHHGTLSNPKYLDYILSWGRQQIDNGVDYLFMDEINAALERPEGYDDYSIRDYRDFLVRQYCQKQQWSQTDARWRDKFQVDFSDRAMCPDGSIGSFDYRVYLQKRGLTADPLAPGNPMLSEWREFRQQRDDAAWKTLTDQLRQYARQKDRTLYISGNGIAKYVDLQVLGVWGLWRVKDGRVDLSQSQMADWQSIVQRGHSVAGRKVPVVLFHDWGFGGFPWASVPPSDRKLWMRVRGPEIYAAGGFFAFPLGPVHTDSGRDGTLAEVARQTAFYAANRDLYLNARPVGVDDLKSEAPALSTALWVRDSSPAVIVHVINRQAADGVPTVRRSVKVLLPFNAKPRRVKVVTPDGRQVRVRIGREAGGTSLTLSVLEAYDVAVLEFNKLPAINAQ